MPCLTAPSDAMWKQASTTTRSKADLHWASADSATTRDSLDRPTRASMEHLSFSDVDASDASARSASRPIAGPPNSMSETSDAMQPASRSCCPTCCPLSPVSFKSWSHERSMARHMSLFFTDIRDTGMSSTRTMCEDRSQACDSRATMVSSNIIHRLSDEADSHASDRITSTSMSNPCWVSN